MSQSAGPTGSSSNFDDEPTVASSQMLHRAVAANAAATLGLNTAGTDDDHTALHSAGVTTRIPTVSPTLGTRKLFGDYELVREIARGGMGVVFEAVQTALKRTVAVKMILAGEFASDEQIQRFFAEARSVAHLDHPNIVPVYEVGEQSGLHFFSMKLVDGGSLTAKIPSFAGKPKEAAELVEKVARAVHHAHQRGVLHRDLKPGNILIDAAGEPMVTDFGLAKVVADDSHMTRSDAVVGTPAYMAPEQARGVRNATTATDVWAIGAILYHLLAGAPPFKAETAVQTLRLVTDSEPPTIRSRRAGVPRDLETVCLKCLQKDPGRRYATAAALADDLRRFIAGEPVEARPVGRAERVWRWCRRNPGPAAATAVVAGAILATVAVLSTAVVVVSASRDEARGLAAENARRADAEKVLRQRAQWDAADRLLDNAIHRYAQEDPAVGLLWLSRALAEAEGIGAADLSTAARRQVAGWSRAVHPLRSVCRQGLAGAKVERVALSPDGTRVFAVGAGQREVSAFDAATGLPAFKPIALPAEPTLLAVDPPGRRLLVATRDGKLAWFDARTGKPLPLAPPPVKPTAVAFDRAGRTLLAGTDDGAVVAWDVEAGRPVGPPLKLTSRAVAVALSDDGRTAAAATADGITSTWEIGGGSAGGDSPVMATVSGDGEPWAVRFAGESDLVVVSAKSARRFDRRSGAERAARKMPEAAGNAAVSRDGLRVVVGDGGSAATVIDLDASPQLTAPLRHAGLLT
ncbi:MAG TPA: serine/threonine-protein kinase, partial [Humisphaera sp.]